jgi:nucleoside phosphorylase
MGYNIRLPRDMHMTLDEPSLSPDARTQVRSVLITAATSWEAKPLAKGLGLSPAGPDRWNGTVGGRAVTLLKTGMGAQRTTAALDAAIVAKDYQLALSAGLCGAMQPDVRPGDVVSDPHEVELELVVPLRETAKALKLPFHFGRILHTNIVLQPEAKRKLGAEHRAAACDMETQAVRRWAHGTPLAVIGVRAVLDGLDDALPADAPQGEGLAELAAFALSRPLRLPGLMSLGRRTSRGMDSLSRLIKAYLENLG